jgi:hypothetical protein
MTDAQTAASLVEKHDLPAFAEAVLAEVATELEADQVATELRAIFDKRPALRAALNES